MKRSVWNGFVRIRDRYRITHDKLGEDLPNLRSLEQALVNNRPGLPYKVKNHVVYNQALDEISADSDIKLILVADNPGRHEQESCRYLVGNSGKLAEGFFKKHPYLGIDFRKNVLILNKTPIHTPRTAGLGELRRLGGETFCKVFDFSQKIMAEFLWEFHSALAPLQVWITGYSEMKKGGVFETYTSSLKAVYAGQDAARESLRKEIFIFRHFSMNQFAIDLNRQTAPGETDIDALGRIGSAYRRRILGDDFEQ